MSTAVATQSKPKAGAATGDQIPIFFGIPDETITISAFGRGSGLHGEGEDVASALEAVDIPDNGSLEQFKDTYESLDNYDTAFALFDKCRGEIAWLKGQILNILKPIEAAKKGLAKHGEWLPFLKSIGVKADTSERLRHIHRQFTRIQSRNLGYSQMITMYKADKKLEKQGAAEEPTEKPTKKPTKKQPADLVMDCSKNIDPFKTTVAAVKDYVVAAATGGEDRKVIETYIGKVKDALQCSIDILASMQRELDNTVKVNFEGRVTTNRKSA